MVFREKIAIMRALGADISRTPKAEGMLGAKYQARQYAAATGAVYMNQFESQDNPAAYKIPWVKKLLIHYHKLIILWLAWVQEGHLLVWLRILNLLM